MLIDFSLFVLSHPSNKRPGRLLKGGGGIIIIFSNLGGCILEGGGGVGGGGLFDIFVHI